MQVDARGSADRLLVAHRSYTTYRSRNPKMQAFILTITMKFGKMDSLALWRTVEQVTRWINVKLGDECVRAFPTTDETEGVFEVAFLVPEAMRGKFDTMTSSILHKVKSRHRRVSMNLRCARPATPSAPVIGTDDRSAVISDGIEMEDLFGPASPA